MKILVTGSSGFVGKSFIKRYEDKYTFSRFSLQKHTIKNIELSKVDAVLHCAALVHQKKILSQKEYNKINTDYPITLAKKAKLSGVNHFVFISTIAVYGEEKEKLDENTECKPITPYGISKLEAERQLQQLNDENFTVSIIRPPMVYGKDAPGNITLLIKLVKKVSVLPFGKIDNKRGFVYIGNLCHLIDTVIQKKISGIFLASDDTLLSTTRLIELISDELHKKTILIKIPFFETLLKQVKPSFHKKLYESLEIDNRQTREILDFKNPFSTKEGIRLMIKGKAK